MPSDKPVNGDIVWSRLKGHPWWPSKIVTKNALPEVLHKSRSLANPGYLPVYFFGSDNYAIVKLDHIMKPYGEHKSEFQDKSSNAKFKLAMELADGEVGGAKPVAKTRGRKKAETKPAEVVKEQEPKAKKAKTTPAKSVKRKRETVEELPAEKEEKPETKKAKKTPTKAVKAAPVKDAPKKKVEAAKRKAKKALKEELTSSTPVETPTVEKSEVEAEVASEKPLEKANGEEDIPKPLRHIKQKLLKKYKENNIGEMSPLLEDLERILDDFDSKTLKLSKINKVLRKTLSLRDDIKGKPAEKSVITQLETEQGKRNVETCRSLVNRIKEKEKTEESSSVVCGNTASS